MNETLLLIIFISLSITNVVLNTVKSIVTIKGGIMSASFINGITFYVYSYLLIFMNCDLNMHLKALITGLVNVVGVAIVKLIEAKMQKDRLWKIELTVPTKYKDILDISLNAIPHGYMVISDKHTVFNIYSESKEQSREVRKLAKRYNGKACAAEMKLL